MGSPYYYVVAYLLGGFTFMPLLIAALFYHAYKTQPVVDSSAPSRSSLKLTSVERDAAKEELKSIPIESFARTNRHDGVASYFAVCRHYVAGGVDGKPPERNTSSTAMNHGESPSVYQSMYRSLVGRGKAHASSLEGHLHKSKKIKMVYFVVIRLGLLMLYDDDEQLEVRHVISLENYDIDIYGGGEALPEGELWVKRSCIRMSRRNQSGLPASDAQPFYLFSSNCSQKEDFYHAMLINQSREGVEKPSPLQFEKDHIVKLFRQLHASENNLETRWINALVGRIFLSLYKTSLLEQFVRNKVNKKLSRVVKPAFISAVQIREIYLGDSAPFITGPKLKELSMEGDLTIEADVKYKGNARIDVAAIARIDLGTRFKAREVELILAVILKSLEGHMYIKIKPPPSNRIWISFVTMPKMEMSVEPIISSRQITYGVILRAIESRIREVLNETLVFPNWDDMPFFDTAHHDFRGGVWHDDSAEATNSKITAEPTLEEGGEGVPMQDAENSKDAVECAVVESADAISNDPSHKSTHRRHKRSSSTKTPKIEGSAVASGAETHISIPPRAMRSHSFATAAIPIVTKDPATIHASSELSRSLESHAASNLKDISSRSQPGTPVESPVGSPHKVAGVWRRQSGSASIASRRSGSDVEPVVLIQEHEEGTILTQEEDPAETEQFSLHKRQTIAAVTAARKWGLGLLAKNHSPSNSQSSLNSPADLEREERSQISVPRLSSSKVPKESLEAGTSSIAYGRGMPLPPIGTPLPGPKMDRKSWTTPLAMLGRKKHELGPTSQPSLHSASTHSMSDSTDSQTNLESSAEIDRPPTLPPRPKDDVPSSSTDDASRGSQIPRAVKSRQPSRRKQISGSKSQRDDQRDSILIITAPQGDTDHESIGSPKGPTNSEIIHSTEGLLNANVDRHDIEHEKLESQASDQGSYTSHQIVRKPVSDSQLPSVPSHGDDVRSPSSSQGSTQSSPATRFAETFAADHPIRVRKARSRHSLIPTPTSSRKPSPIPLAETSQSQGQTLEAGRRTSTRSLQDTAKAERRISGGYIL